MDDIGLKLTTPPFTCSAALEAEVAMPGVTLPTDEARTDEILITAIEALGSQEAAGRWMILGVTVGK